MHPRVEKLLRPAAVLACSGLGLALGWDLRRAYIAGEAWGKAWENGSVGAPWSWVSFIHSPVWNSFMFVTEQWSLHSGVPERILIYSLAALSTALVPWLLWMGAGRVPTALLALGGLLSTLSANTLRPFEEYPAGRPVTLLAVAALLVLDRRLQAGDRRLRWPMAGIAAVFLATEYHLSTWFLLGPMLAALFVARRDERRTWLLVAAGSILAFLATTWPGLYDVLAAGSGRRDWVYQPLAQVLTLEWTNPWLLVPVALTLHPAIRRRDPAAAALAFGLATFALVHQGLFVQGWAIGGPILTSHHYFELVDPVLVLCGVRALAVGWERRRSPRVGPALAVVAGLLLLTQVLDYRWGRGILAHRAEVGWTEP